MNFPTYEPRFNPANPAPNARKFDKNREINPADYHLATDFLLWSKEPFAMIAWAPINDDAKCLIWEARGSLAHYGTCELCGQSGHYAYGVVFQHHADPFDIIIAGHMCAGKFGMDLGKSVRPTMTKRVADQVARDAAKAAGLAAIEAAGADVVAAFELDDDFVQDVKATVLRTGRLSDAQSRAVVRAADRIARQAAEADEPKGQVPTGRVDVTGEVLAAKYKETPYGTTPKMLVKVTNDDGTTWKVWGTMPSALESAAALAGGFDALRGATVQITATVEPSRDDQAFGFWKRPTCPKVLDWGTDGAAMIAERRAEGYVEAGDLVDQITDGDLPAAADLAPLPDRALAQYADDARDYDPTRHPSPELAVESLANADTAGPWTASEAIDLVWRAGGDPDATGGDMFATLGHLVANGHVRVGRRDGRVVFAL